MKEGIGDMEKENDLREEKCGTYELQLEDPKEKVKDDSENIDKAFSENKLKELKSAWKKEREEENISFAEVIKKQIQDKTKDTVIQIVKEKEEDLVRDTVDRKKCMVIYGLQEKKNPQWPHCQLMVCSSTTTTVATLSANGVLLKHHHSGHTVS